MRQSAFMEKPGILQGFSRVAIAHVNRIRKVLIVRKLRK